jgi:predicted enzyme related to lactoylglutathione lyase
MQLRVCIDVEDLEKGIAFYREALGLTLGRRLGSKWAELLGASSPVDLLQESAGSSPTPRASAVRDYARHWTPVHLDCVVPDLDAAVRRAQAAGATLDQDIQPRKWGRIAILADPFGNGFCLLEFSGRGYDEMLQGRVPGTT